MQVSDSMTNELELTVSRRGLRSTFSRDRFSKWHVYRSPFLQNAGWDSRHSPLSSQAHRHRFGVFVRVREQTGRRDSAHGRRRHERDIDGKRGGFSCADFSMEKKWRDGLGCRWLDFDADQCDDR
ncbi:MAG: hypothetical protein ABIZ49_06595 [Opitutaceae bacterium]